MLLIHETVTFHMQYSGQYSINTEEASSLQLKLWIKQLCKSYADSDVVKKKRMTEQATLSEHVSENDFDM